MTGDWQQEIKREYTGGNVRFDFPVRPLGRGRLVGIFLIGFGLLFAWMPGHTAWEFIHKFLNGEHNVGTVIFGVFPLLFVVAGALPTGMGLLVMFGRCRVEWRDGQLRSAELLGPLHWTRRLPRKPVRRLEVAASMSTRGTAAPRQFENFSALAAVFADDSKKLVVLGYPKDWVLGVAQELQGYVGGGTAGFAPAKVEVVETAPQNENDRDVPAQPAGSRVQVEERGSGVRLAVPPVGLWRGSMGLFAFSLLWCGFMAVFTTLMALPGTKRDGSLRGMILFVAGFWAIGLGMMAGAVNLGRRTAEFTAEPGRLRVETKGLFGVKQREWSRAEIAALRVDRSAVEVNNRPVLELQVHPVAGKKAGFLAGRDEAELRWMATRLRRALDVPARPAEP